jgi:hypothetical protein
MDCYPTFNTFRIRNTKSQATLQTSQGHLCHYSSTCRYDFIQLASFRGNNRLKPLSEFEVLKAGLLKIRFVLHMAPYKEQQGHYPQGQAVRRHIEEHVDQDL